VYEGTQNKAFTEKDNTDEGENKLKKKKKERFRFLETTVHSSNSYYIILK
jgi:hypothetical protein